MSAPVPRTPRASLPVSKITQILNHPQYLKVFRIFLESSHCDENLSFWLEVEQYKTETQQERVDHAKYIWEKYLELNSSKEVNISDDIRLLTQKVYESSNNSPASDLFTHAQTAVYLLMETESFPKFIVSNLFKEFLGSDQEKKKAILKKLSLNEKSSKNLENYLSRVITDVFGGSLRTIMERQKVKAKEKTLPFILERIIEATMQVGLGVSFVLLTNEEQFSDALTRLKERFNKNEDVIPQRTYRIDELMSLLYLFLIKLREPILSKEFLNYLMKLFSHSTENLVNALIGGILELPDYSRNCFQAILFLSFHLHNNIEFNQLNLMELLKIILALFFTQSNLEEQDKLSEEGLQKITAIIMSLISKYPALFPSRYPFASNKYLSLKFKYASHKSSVCGLTQLKNNCLLSIDTSATAINIWNQLYGTYMGCIDTSKIFSNKTYQINAMKAAVNSQGDEFIWIIGEKSVILSATSPYSLIKVISEDECYYSISDCINDTIWLGSRDSISVFNCTSLELVTTINILTTNNSKVDENTHKIPKSMVLVDDNLWCAFSDGFIHVFNTTTFQELTHFQAHTKAINSMIYCESRIWTCSDDYSIAVWKPSFDFECRLTKHTTRVVCLGALGDDYVISSGWGTELIIWDAKKFQFITEVSSGHNDIITSINFFADGLDEILCWTTAADKCLSIYNISLNNWIVDYSRLGKSEGITRSFSEKFQLVVSDDKIDDRFPAELQQLLNEKGIGVIDSNSLAVNWSQTFGSNIIGNIYRGKLKSKSVIVNVVNESVYTNKAILNHLIQYLKFCQSINHPNISLCMGFSIHNSNILIVNEYMKKRSLRELIVNSETKTTTLQRLSIAKEIAYGLNWLHQMNPPVAHLDLKDSDILIGASFNVQIAKTGFFHIKKNLNKLQTGCPIHLAPETIRGEDSGIKSDIFSFGLLLWQCWTWKLPLLPFQNKTVDTFQELCSAIENQTRISLVGFPTRLGQLILKCQDENPRNRPSLSAILDEFDDVLIDSIIWDKEGRYLWRSNFKSLNECLWIKFANCLISFSSKEFLNPENPNFTALKTLFDPEDNGSVSIQRFSDILNWFGPLCKSTVTKILNLLPEKWFHGDMDSSEAEKKLVATGKKGTFLVRLSGAGSNNFYISVHMGDKVAHHRFNQQDGNYIFSKTKFENICDLIRKNKSSLGLRYPCKQSIFFFIYNPPDRKSMGYQAVFT